MQEPLPKPDRVPALDSLLIPRQDDDDEDLERLAAGLKVSSWPELQTIQLMLLHHLMASLTLCAHQVTKFSAATGLCKSICLQENATESALTRTWLHCSK